MTEENEAQETMNTEVKKDEKRENNENPDEDIYVSNYGFDLYPRRREKKRELSFLQGLFYNYGEKEDRQKLACETRVYSCLMNNPILKLMLGALKGSGCEVDIRRHFSCEICDPAINGGYDAELNQVVICQNTSRTKNLITGVLFHEMVHMFDYCRNDMDLKSLDHLACTEIRAANLVHCSYLSAVTNGTISPFRVKESHQECVKWKAMMSMTASRKITSAEAMTVINRVFAKCYADLEPLGRRIHGSYDINRACAEAPYYGYE